MYTVALLGWSPGFIVNQLVALLREHGYSLADAFRLASQVAEGAQVVLPFPTLAEADGFTKAARTLNIQLELRVPAKSNRLANCRPQNAAPNSAPALPSARQKDSRQCK
jgi:hypothetical protein